MRLPTAAKRLVEPHQLLGGRLLRRDIFGLQFIELALRIEHIEEVRQPSVVTLARKIGKLALCAKASVKSHYSWYRLAGSAPLISLER